VACFLERSEAVTTPAYVAVCLLVIATPFETLHPVFTLPFQQVSLTEAVWLGVALVWAGTHAWHRRWPRWRTPITPAWVAWMVLMALAAALADVDRINAAKTTARLLVIGVTAWMVATSVTDARRMAGVLAVAAVTGAIVAVMAVLEAWRVPGVVSSLDWFRDGVRVVGGEVRASSTLQYPTITAMYLELVLCGSLGALLWLGERKGWAIASAGIVVVSVLAVGLALTLTRAAVIATVCGALVAAGWRYRQRGADRGVAVIAACVLCIVVAPVVAASSETARARWSTEGREGWYRAAFDAPAALTARPGERIEVPVSVTNRGRITWSSRAEPPFFLSYHWVDAASTRVVDFDGDRTELPADAAPGMTVPVVMQVRTPLRTGDFRIAWDVVQERRLWFGAEPGSETTFTAVRVEGSPLSGAVEHPSAKRSPAALPVPVRTPGRLQLWRAALAMAADHPWFGVGPDNFRLRSGAYLDDVRVDPTVHSNNVYLEVLTGGGVFAVLAFGWFLWRSAGTVRATAPTLAPGAAAAYTGVAAAGAAYLVHGCLDSFLTFTPTAFASAVILGLLVAPTMWVEEA